MANNPSDSLRTALRLAENDTSKIEILLELAETQLIYSYRESTRYAETALDLSQNLKYSVGEAQASRLLGRVYWASSSYKKSRMHLRNAIQIFDNLKEDRSKAKCYNTIGLGYYYQASYPLAIENLTRSLEIFSNLKDSTQISRLSNNLALVYEANGKFELANEYFILGLNHELSYRTIYDQFQSGAARHERIYNNERLANEFIPKLREELQAGKQDGDFYKMASSASRIGGFYNMLNQSDSALHYLLIAGKVYDSINEPTKHALELLDIAKCYSKLNENKKAKEYFDFALPILIKEQMHPIVASWHIHQGNHLIGIGNDLEAIRVFQSGLTHSDSLGHLASSARFNRLLSGIYHRRGSFTDAIRHAQLALRTAEGIDSFTQKKEAIERLYLSHKASNDLTNAILYQEELNQMTQLKENASMQRASQEFEAKFEHQIQAREIDVLTKENELKDSRLSTQRILIYFSILFVTTVIIFLIILRRRQNKTNLLNLKITKQNVSLALKNDENEVLMKEIHHRVKNNLQIVSNILNLQKRRTENQETKTILDHTKSRVGVMGLIHEHLYKTDNIDLIALDRYIPDLVDRLISSMHESNDIKVDYDILPRKIDLDSTIYIGLITHEIVINAIKYAFENNPNPYLKIQILLEEGNMVLKFKDNGPGLQGSMDGFGWTIIQSILKNMQGTVSHSNDNGFSIVIILKDISVAEP